MKKIISLVLVFPLSMLYGMQSNTENIIKEKDPLNYIFVNIVTLLCPNQLKAETSIQQSLTEKETYLSLLSLGACSLTEDLKNPIKENLFSLLSKVDVPTSIDYNPSSEDLYIDDERLAPAIFCAFCMAKTHKEGELIYQHIKEHMSKQSNPFKNNWFSDFFSCPETKFSIVLEGLDLMFNAERRHTALELCETMLEILQEGKKENCSIIITANMSHSCCAQLLKTNNLHDLFPDIHTSDNAGCLTPQKEFYETFITKKNIKPEQCIIIDDHEQNLIGAKKIGAQTLHKYKNEQFHAQLKRIITSKKPSEKQ
jgi:FMN phosphatase YigB (HAD superfamily)